MKFLFGFYLLLDDLHFVLKLISLSEKSFVSFFILLIFLPGLFILFLLCLIDLVCGSRDFLDGSYFLFLLLQLLVDDPLFQIIGIFIKFVGDQADRVMVVPLNKFLQGEKVLFDKFRLKGSPLMQLVNLVRNNALSFLVVNLYQHLLLLLDKVQKLLLVLFMVGLADDVLVEAMDNNILNFFKYLQKLVVLFGFFWLKLLLKKFLVVVSMINKRGFVEFLEEGIENLVNLQPWLFVHIFDWVYQQFAQNIACEPHLLVLLWNYWPYCFDQEIWHLLDERRVEPRLWLI